MVLISKYFVKRANVNAKPLHTIDKEIAATRQRYENYIRNTANKFEARRSNVTIRDPHTMVDDGYWELRDNIDAINSIAKKHNKEIVFEDARALTRDTEFDAIGIDNKLSSKVLVSLGNNAKDPQKIKLVDKFEKPEIPFMKKISNALGELLSGKQGANVDNQLNIR